MLTVNCYVLKVSHQAINMSSNVDWDGIQNFLEKQMANRTGVLLPRVDQIWSQRPCTPVTELKQYPEPACTTAETVFTRGDVGVVPLTIKLSYMELNT